MRRTWQASCASVSDSTISRRYLLILSFAALGSAMIWQELRFWPFYIDDSYISLVYAKNWIAGSGLTYNGKFVEGYSNFLWVILLGIVGRLGVDLELASRLLGMLFSVLMLPILAALGRQLCGSALAGWLAGALLCASGPFLAWAVGGLETMLYTLLLLLTLHLVLKEHSAQAMPFSAISAILLALTRPEGIGLVLVIGGYLALLARRRATTWAYVFGWAGVFALGFGLFEAWRYLYYHDWLPAPVLAKSGSIAEQLRLALTRLLPLLNAWWLAAAGAVVGFILLLIQPQTDRYAAQLLALVAAAYLGFIVLTGSDWMPMHRFVVPLLPLLFLGLAGGAIVLGESLAARPRISMLGWLLPALLLAAPALQIGAWTEQHREQAIRDGSGALVALRQLAQQLIATAPPGATLAVVDAGLLAYETGWPTLDLVGLNDQHIAHLPGGFGLDLDKDYVLAARPTYIEFHPLRSSSGQPIFIDFLPSARLYYDIEFQRWYDMSQDLPLHPFVRRQTPREHTLMDAFYKASYQSATIKDATVGQLATVEVVVQNDGTGTWVGSPSLYPGAVFVTCRLRDPATQAVVAESWGSLGDDLAPGQRRMISLRLMMPQQPGDYVLEIDMVLNEVAKFSAQGNAIKIVQIRL